MFVWSNARMNGLIRRPADSSGSSFSIGSRSRSSQHWLSWTFLWCVRPEYYTLSMFVLWLRNIVYDTTGGRSTVVALGTPLGKKLLAARCMRSIGGGACTGCEYKNWSNTYIRMKICEKPSGLSWWMDPPWYPLGFLTDSFLHNLRAGVGDTYNKNSSCAMQIKWAIWRINTPYMWGVFQLTSGVPWWPVPCPQCWCQSQKCSAPGEGRNLQTTMDQIFQVTVELSASRLWTQEIVLS